MSVARPLFVDTSAFYAHYDETDQYHRRAEAVFDAIRDGTLSYRPLVTSQAVLAELATLVLYRTGHDPAVAAVDELRSSRSLDVLVVDRPSFDSAAEQFERYDDQLISFVDHTSATLAADRQIAHVFSFDDDFRTLGFTCVPDDTGLAG